jgi:hypothetical protein
LLAGLDPSIGKIYCHGAVEKGNDAYRLSGVTLPETISVSRHVEHSETAKTQTIVNNAHTTDDAHSQRTISLNRNHTTPPPIIGIRSSKNVQCAQVILLFYSFYPR